MTGDYKLGAFVTRAAPNDPLFPAGNTTGGGLEYMHKTGYGWSIMHKHIRESGDELTGAAVVNVSTSYYDKLDAKLFATTVISQDALLPAINIIGCGLDYRETVGHRLRIYYERISGFGHQLTAKAQVNVLNNINHSLNVTACAIKITPDSPFLMSSMVLEAGLNYSYKDRVGAFFTVANNDFFERADLSCMGKINLFKSLTSSVELGAGVTKSISPLILNSSWQPCFGLTYSGWLT